MTPLTTEAAILAYLGREGESTAGKVAGFLRSPPKLADVYLVDVCLHNLLVQDGHICVRTPKSETEPRYRLSAKGRRLFAKHKAAVAAAYGLEG